MPSELEQALAEMESKFSEESFERWRRWSHEYARTEEGRAEVGVENAPDLPQSSRRGVWVAMVVASIVGAIAWGLIFLLGRWVARAVYG